MPTQDDEMLAEPDVDDDDLQEGSAFQDLTQLHQVLCQTPGLDEMRKKLQSLVLPSVPMLIDSVVNQHLKVNRDTSEVSCIIEWELLQYMKHEDLGVSDIEPTFTMTGTFDRSCAMTFRGCMSSRWQNWEPLLKTLKDAVEAAFNDGKLQSLAHQRLYFKCVVWSDD